ncbi:hypothetical protein TrCOL_g2058 [Triparma columacea]|uniref:Uncharacterized protein n=1 Tax=Triparma columacea TaxID=722753 RepID=A0A9W7L809_9STRA|nr:hypothetical protein TrCOL_g2058 [Triparma columacea]
MCPSSSSQAAELFYPFEMAFLIDLHDAEDAEYAEDAALVDHPPSQFKQSPGVRLDEERGLQFRGSQRTDASAVERDLEVIENFCLFDIAEDWSSGAMLHPYLQRDAEVGDGGGESAHDVVDVPQTRRVSSDSALPSSSSSSSPFGVCVCPFLKEQMQRQLIYDRPLKRDAITNMRKSGARDVRGGVDGQEEDKKKDAENNTTQTAKMIMRQGMAALPSTTHRADVRAHEDWQRLATLWGRQRQNHRLLRLR